MTISTPLDANGQPTLLGTLDTDGATPVSVKVDSSSHRLKVSDGASGSNFTAKINSQRDNNRHTAVWGVSSADGVTPIYIAVDSSGSLLTKST